MTNLIELAEILHQNQLNIAEKRERQGMEKGYMKSLKDKRFQSQKSTKFMHLCTFIFFTNCESNLTCYLLEEYKACLIPYFSLRNM